MKKNIIFFGAIFILIVVLLLIYLVPLIAWVVPSETYIKNKEYVNEYSKIVNFIDYKSDKCMLVVKNAKRNDSNEDIDYDYHIDENDELYMMIKEIDYEEVLPETKLSTLYDIDYKSKDISKRGAQKNYYCPRYVTICTNNIISIDCSIEGSPWDGASKSRYYKMSDNDYNNLLEKIDYILKYNVAY